jgi:hypothetical protein
VQNDLTVAELIEMHGRYYSRRRSVDELIELVELGGGCRTKPARRRFVVSRS